MDIFDLFAKISIDTSEYEAGVAGVAQKSKPAQEAINKIGLASDTLHNKYRVLAAQYGEAQKKVDELTEAFNKSAQETGYSSKETQGLAEKLKAAEEKANGLKGEIDQLVGSTKEIGDSAQNAGEKTLTFGDILKANLTSEAIIAGAKAIASALQKIGSAFIEAGKASIDTGMQFDSAMSQVAATMGLTTQDIQNNVDGAGNTFFMLREKALEMGSATKFTSQEAAEGLNILAMSGYDATKAVGMIEDVLHLAAAGSMDMASAAGYVSGAMKGFADDTKNAKYYADLMAKGATLANTDVTQLGEALSGGAAAAKSYGQSAETVTLALLRLAEQGEVGSAASTALGAAMKNLYAPTDQAVKLLQQLGVQAFDPATGSARDFNDVVNELDAALSGYSDQQKTAYAQTIFGIQGFDAYNKMVVTSTEKQGEWATALSEASGEAERQYETMTDNLVGDIDKWNSALDGFKIALSDQLTPTLREFTQFGADSVGQITTAFQEDGLSGAMGALGGILSKGLGMIAAQLPSAVNAGMQLLGAVGQGLIDNLPVITDAAIQIATMLGIGLVSALPDIGSSATEVITTLADGIAEQLPALIPAAIEVIFQLADTITDPDNLGYLLDSALAIIQALADGLIEMIPKLREKIPQIVQNIVTFIIESAPKLLVAAAELITTLGVALVDYAVNLPGYIWDVITAIYDGFIDGVDRIKEAGSQLLAGLWNGITDKIDWLKEKVSGVVNTIKSWFTGKDGFDEHSPSKWSQGVSEFVMDGLAIGFKNREGKVLETVDDVASEVKTRLDDFLGDVEHAMFLAEKNGAATAADMVDAYRLMQEKVHEAAEWYRAQGYAETSDEIQKLQKLWWGYADNVAAAQLEAANAVIDSIKAQYESLSSFIGLKSDVSDLEYQLWERTEGKNSSDIEKYAKKLQMLSVQQENQESVVDAAAAAYAAVVEQYGAASEESYNYQKTLLQEKLALQDLLDQIEKLNAARAQAQSEAFMQEAQVRWENSGLGIASATAINAGYTTPHEVAQIANINLVTPDGKVLAEYTAPHLVDYMDANGTPIVNPKR